MNLTLKDVVEFDSMRGCKLHNIENYEDVYITGITIMEAPDIADWMKEGQILLTSLFSISESIEEQITLIEKLAEKKVGALFVKKRYSKEIEKNFIDKCKDFGLMLVEIPEETAYTSITYPVMKRLFNIQLERADYFIESHNTFMQIALRNKGVSEILKELKLRLKKEVLLIDENKRVIDCFMCPVTLQTIVEFLGDDNKKIEGNLVYSKKTIVNGDFEAKGLLFPIKVLDRVRSYIFVEAVEEEFFSEKRGITLESAITVLKMEKLKKIAVDEMIKKSKNEILDDIFSGNTEDLEALQSKARVVGWDLNRKYVVAIYRVKNKRWSKSSIETIGYEMEQIAEKLESSISCSSKILISQYIIRVKNDKMIVLFPFEEEDDTLEFIKNISRIFQVRMKTNKEAECINVGVGDPSEGIAFLSKSYKEAEEALNLGETIESENCIQFFRDLGIYRMLCSFKDKNNLTEFVPEPLVKLVKSDMDSNNNLLNTLEVLLKCDCNASKAAQELFLHYKTLLYRMNKIKNIMGIDFMLYENRLSIEVGMKIVKIIDIKKLVIEWEEGNMKKPIK